MSGRAWRAWRADVWRAHGCGGCGGGRGNAMASRRGRRLHPRRAAAAVCENRRRGPGVGTCGSSLKAAAAASLNRPSNTTLVVATVCGVLAAASCTWTPHSNRYSGGYADDHSTTYSLSKAKAKCLDMGALCKAITCPKSSTGAGCTLRASPTLDDSPSGETTYVTQNYAEFWLHPGGGASSNP